jgi:hypothetical protein
MNKLDKLRERIERGEFPKEYEEFGGANLIITNDPTRHCYDHDIVVHTEFSGALSWLVFQLKDVYHDDIDCMNKHGFYPSLGIMIKEKLCSPECLFETMLYIIDELEKEWGTR